MSDRFEEYRCRYCGFKAATGARLSSHLSQSPRCLDRIIADNQPTPTSHKRYRSPTPEASGQGWVDDQLVHPNDEPLYSSLLKGQPSTKRARVEAEDVPFKMNNVSDKFNPPAGKPITRPANTSNDFERLRENQESLGDQPWAPFSSIEDWDYARWIMNSGLSQRQIDAMLALDLVSQPNSIANGFMTDAPGVQIKSSSPSFHNNRALLNKVDSLPTGPEWEVIELSIEGRGANGDREIVTEKVELWRRDPVECVRELFSNPAFKNGIRYEPQKVYTNESRTERVFGEMWMGEWWWETQVSVLEVGGKHIHLMNAER